MAQRHNSKFSRRKPNSLTAWLLHFASQSHLCERSVQSNDLPTGIEFLNIHCTHADDFGGVRIFRILNGPRDHTKRQIRFQQLNLDSRRIDSPHVGQIPVLRLVRAIQVFPSVKLLRIDDGQEAWRIPINRHQSVDVVSIPPIEHLEQNLVDDLRVRLGNGSRRCRSRFELGHDQTFSHCRPRLGKQEEGRRKPLSGGIAFSTRDLPNEQPPWRVAKSHDHLNLSKIAIGNGKYKQPEKSNAGSFPLNMENKEFYSSRSARVYDHLVDISKDIDL